MKPSIVDTQSVAIIGSGVTGLCIATELMQRGIVPIVYDRQKELGPKSCSWWAGGMLAPFCEAESAEDSVLFYGKKASQWWQKHTGLVKQLGSLVLDLNQNQADLKRFSKRTEGYEVLDSVAITNLEPDISKRFSQGLHYQEEAHLPPRESLQKLKTTLIKQGVSFVHKNVEATELARDHLVIDCRGMMAKPDINGLRAVKGEMLILRCSTIQLQRPIRLLHPRIPLYIVPRENGIYMLGATMIESSANKHASVRSIMELLSSAYALNPAFGEAEILEIGVDSRPAFNDNLPKINHQGQIISANGLYRHGFLLAPTLATMVADYLHQGIEPEWFDYSITNTH